VLHRKPGLFIAALSVIGRLCAQAQDWQQQSHAAMRLLEMGRYADAERLYLAALDQARAFGENDPRLAAAMNNLGSVYHSQGKYAEAEDLFRRSLALMDHAAAPDWPAVAIALSNLAEVERARGRSREAATLLERALEMHKLSPPAEDRGLGTNLLNLGQIYLEQARYGQAEAALRRALAIFGTTSGPGPDGAGAEQPRRAGPGARPLPRSRAVLSPCQDRTGKRTRAGAS